MNTNLTEQYTESSIRIRTLQGAEGKTLIRIFHSNKLNGMHIPNKIRTKQYTEETT